MEEQDFCERCHNPIGSRSKWRRAVSIVAYHIWMNLPGRLAMGKSGFAILPIAGEYAFRCHCKRGEV